jgi:hypothetical protein
MFQNSTSVTTGFEIELAIGEDAVPSPRHVTM